MINLITLLIFGTLFFMVYKNIKKQSLLLIAKGFLQIGILILFIGSFFKLFLSLPSNIYIKLIFCVTYVWCTVGINVNFMVPLIALIDKEIDKK
ncbi:Hypothetical protein P9515_11171 [Prochlorococcus marinus str. MIT 9515]|uniref:Uncharacterized protein n=1 Tax=Prochlorococcus marinus (strain MIT 9515) TaxID=167542 RepID=A2BX13_PROM5|nr:Hypothetical protein P9515_11171 [Prochlorococcus marinus str. MIT 9515]